MSEKSEDKRSGIYDELNQLSFKRQQLIERQNLVTLLIQFKKSVGQNDEDDCKHRDEIQKIEEKLEELSRRKIELERQLSPSNRNGSCSSEVIFVDNPPSARAPEVILDLSVFPRKATQTQCPYCHQFITTEIITQVGSVSYLVCFICVLFGGVAGCCMIPFCSDCFKDVIHKCPKCRSKITTSKKF